MADYVVTPRGEMISGISLTENFAVMVPGIAQLQIVQETVDHFTFRIVRGHDFGPQSEKRIAHSSPNVSVPMSATNVNSSIASPKSLG